MIKPNTHPADPPQQLRQILQRVHAELVATPRVDPASRRLLHDVLGDIERVLGEPAPPAGGRPARAHTPRLEALVIAFEAEHPTLAGSLRQLIDLLDRGGF